MARIVNLQGQWKLLDSQRKVKEKLGIFFLSVGGNPDQHHSFHIIARILLYHEVLLLKFYTTSLKMVRDRNIDSVPFQRCVTTV